MRVVSIENGFRRIVARLHLQRRPIDAAAIEPRRRAGFQTAEREADIFQRARQPQRRRFADAAGGNLFFADMDEAAQKRAGGQHHGAAGNFAAVGEFHAAHAAVRRSPDRRPRLRSPANSALPNCRLHRRRIELAIGLRARAAHRRAFAAVEHAKLDAARSATRPIRPSRASISRTRWPLPRPPMAGLQDMAPMVAN